MRLTFLGKDTVNGGSPTLFATDRDTYVVQGWKVPDDPNSVEVPARLLAFLERRTRLDAKLSDTGLHTFPSVSSLKEWGRVNPVGRVVCDRFELFPGSVRTYAGKGSGSRLDRRSTRAAGVALTPIPFGAESVRRERLWC
jgi:hypothetical protein